MTHAAMLFIIISMAIVLQKLLGHPIAPMVDAIRFIDFGAPYINNIQQLRSLNEKGYILLKIVSGFVTDICN